MNITLWRGSPAYPKREVHQYFSCCNMENTILLNGAVTFYREGSAALAPASDIWQLSAKPYVSICVTLLNNLIDVWVPFLIYVSHDGILFNRYDVFPVSPNVPWTKHEYYLPFWAARFAILNTTGIDMTAYGNIKAEAFR